MNISSMLNNTKSSTPGLGQVYGGGFGLENNRSSVLFSQSAGSESTVGDSMFGGSILSSVGGKSSIVDFNTSSGAMVGVRRTSIALNMKPEQNRRKTLQQHRPIMENATTIHENDRPSMLAAHEEGSINAIKPTINAGGKCFAEVNNAQAASQQEEFKDSVENNARCDSFRSGSGSASGRQFNVIGGFTEEDSSRAPFEPENGAMQASGQMNNQPIEQNAAEEEDDDCNLGESEEQSLPRAPVQYAGVNNKNQASLGRSNM